MSKPASRLLQAFRLFMKQNRSTNQVKEIGEDHLGNKYYEEIRSNSARGIHRYYRTKDHDDDDPLKNLVKVPPLWDAWLRFRRTDPPSQDEMIDNDQYYEKQQASAAKKPQIIEDKVGQGKFPRLPLKVKTL